MTLAVEVQDASEGPMPDADELTAWAQAAWCDPEAAAEIVIRVCDEDEGRQLNLEYRGKDRATNVLSFPYEPLPELDMNHVGDLVICAPVVVREAAEQDKAVRAHWAHMVVHGTLHLQGYDHETDSQAEQMEGLETEILKGLGFPAPYADDERQ